MVRGFGWRVGGVERGGETWEGRSSRRWGGGCGGRNREEGRGKGKIGKKDLRSKGKGLPYFFVVLVVVAAKLLRDGVNVDVLEQHGHVAGPHDVDLVEGAVDFCRAVERRGRGG